MPGGWGGKSAEVMRPGVKVTKAVEVPFGVSCKARRAGGGWRGVANQRRANLVVVRNWGRVLSG